MSGCVGLRRELERELGNLCLCALTTKKSKDVLLFKVCTIGLGFQSPG